MFHLTNGNFNGVLQISLDPTVDDFYYDGSARYRVLSLSGVYRRAQIVVHLEYTCDGGYCGRRCEEFCQDLEGTEDTVQQAASYTDSATNYTTEIWQNSTKCPVMHLGQWEALSQS